METGWTTAGERSVLVNGAATALGKLPCRVVPRDDSPPERWAASHQGEIQELLRQHGAVLFDGFPIFDVASFSAFASKLCPRLFGENFEHPLVHGSDCVYWTTPYPPHHRLLFHNENAHLPSWPGLILFGCIQPAAQGGETLLADSAEVLKVLPTAVVERFRDKGVRYQRIFGGGLGLDWRVAFRTNDREVVDSICLQQGNEHTWLADDRLRLRWWRPATQVRPRSGQEVWFNQVTHFHPSLLPGDMGAQIRSLYGTEELPRNCTYGDGSPIDDDVAQAISLAFDGLAFGQAWERGQVLLVDNMRLAHGRQPYTGERRIAVALGEMQNDS